MQARRDAWFADKYCESCGSLTDLELDHIDPTMKVSHRIWSWSEERRDAEVAKCQVLCHTCHLKKNHDQLDITQQRGTDHHAAKLTDGQVLEIRSMYSSGAYSYRRLGVMFNVDFSLIGYIVRREKWQHI